MSNNWIAFLVGLFGSVHCVGMCGPLAFAVPVNRSNWWRLVFDKVTYNLGRIITYSFLGLLIGLVGRQLWLYGLQQGVSMVSGILILLAGISRIFKLRLANNSFFSILTLPFNRSISFALQHRAGHFVIGLLNGFLPCGFVYLALVGAVNTSSPMNAAQYMFYFGLGTFPLMLIATVSSAFAGPLVRRRINRAIPFFMIFLGLWFVLRGLNLNIPYLSPAKNIALGADCR